MSFAPCGIPALDPPRQPSRREQAIVNADDFGPDRAGSQGAAPGVDYLGAPTDEFQTLMNPFRFGILTFGSDLPSSTEFLGTIPSTERR